METMFCRAKARIFVGVARGISGRQFSAAGN
jgi:hypothetical protein